MSKLVIYGATGYTGKLMSRMAVEKGLRPVLSGRNEEKLDSLATPLGLSYKAVSIDDPNGLDSLLKDADVVLHCAGPFSSTATQMVESCLRTGTHYLDITGEIEVFEKMHSLDSEARNKNIMVMPGVGFDVVPTDCLAAHMKSRMPDATDLSLSLGGMKGVSPGTAKTAVESIGKKTLVRRNGEIVSTDPIIGTNDFGRGERRTIATSWGDVSTAFHTTGIPNVTVFFESNKQLEKMVKMNAITRWFLSTSFMQKKIKSKIEKNIKGPSSEQRANARGTLIGEASNASGQQMVSRLIVPEGYTLTCMTGLEIAKRVLDGEGKIGFHTPAGLFGADFILQFEGVKREDVS